MNIISQYEYFKKNFRKKIIFRNILMIFKNLKLIINDKFYLEAIVFIIRLIKIGINKRKFKYYMLEQLFIKFINSKTELTKLIRVEMDVRLKIIIKNHKLEHYELRFIDIVRFYNYDTLNEDVIDFIFNLLCKLSDSRKNRIKKESLKKIKIPGLDGI